MRNKIIAGSLIALLTAPLLFAKRRKPATKFGSSTNFGRDVRAQLDFTNYSPSANAQNNYKNDGQALLYTLKLTNLSNDRISFHPYLIAWEIASEHKLSYTDDQLIDLDQQIPNQAPQNWEPGSTITLKAAFRVKNPQAQTVRIFWKGNLSVEEAVYSNR
ncbi:hypothetical protein BK816_01390 [Boudabousia tangfeifanii]|uniref:DUF4352 domain-containing protein n=1 Tax=Boudabousia tangfeifanii TaxID=1912795 RepID=A0A1D9MIU5_9ACTO|nr:hypothetical protein [Boudabousia tangfeifanii]AOZ72113.1 hypothetical protein BK816_01390 [Boudabousia tangfeifanii]